MPSSHCSVYSCSCSATGSHSTYTCTTCAQEPAGAMRVPRATRRTPTGPGALKLSSLPAERLPPLPPHPVLRGPPLKGSRAAPAQLSGGTSSCCSSVVGSHAAAPQLAPPSATPAPSLTRDSLAALGNATTRNNQLSTRAGAAAASVASAASSLTHTSAATGASASKRRSKCETGTAVPQRSSSGASRAGAAASSAVSSASTAAQLAALEDRLQCERSEKAELKRQIALLSAMQARLETLVEGRAASQDASSRKI